MDIIEQYGWLFSFDKTETAKYYAEYDGLCNCAVCRNYYKAIHCHSPELREFLEQFGIDMAKPVETWSHNADKAEKLADYMAYYPVKGTAESSEGYEIDIGAVQIVVRGPAPSDVVHCPEFPSSTELTAPYFIFEIYNLWLPWLISEDMDELYPEKKSFMERVRSIFNGPKAKNGE